MKKLLAMLGLPETATEDEACAKVQALIDGGTAAAAAQKTAEAACRKAKCEAFIAAHKGQIADEAKFRVEYDKNPDAVEAAFGVFKAAPDKQQTPSQTRIVASKAKTPEAGAADADAAAQRRTKQSEAVSACRAANPGMSCREAEAVCRRQQPALFSVAAEAEAE